MSEPEYIDEFADLVKKTKQRLKSRPNMALEEFANGFLFALFESVRSEMAELRGDVDEILDSIEVPEEALLTDFESLLFNVGLFVDKFLVAAGWIVKKEDGTAGFADAFSPEMRLEFEGLSKQMVAVRERIQEARDQIEDDDDEDDDEDDEDDEDEDASESVTTSPGFVTAPRTEAANG